MSPCVIIVDSHPATRALLAHLARRAGLTVLGEAPDEAGVRAVLRADPGADFVVLSASRFRGFEPAPARVQALSPREHEVLELMAAGRTNRFICTALGISERAVERYVTAIFRKLGLHRGEGTHRRVQAVLAYLTSDGTA